MLKLSRINPVLEILRASPERIHQLMVQKESDNRRLKHILNLAQTAHVPVTLVSRAQLDQMDKHHQGLMASVIPKKASSIKDMVSASSPPFLVILDGIVDPQNLGAILRSAEGAGVNGVILPERRAAGLTEAVYKVSAGASEHVRLAQVKNLARTMDRLRQMDLWLIGAEGGSKKMWHEFDYSLPLVLVLGSEGKGLRPLIRKKCDVILSLPLLGKITSLNVAAAAAIFFYEVVRQRQKR